jgi:hypothetical protein
MSFGKRMIDMLSRDAGKSASELLTAEELLKYEDKYNQQICTSFIEDDEIVLGPPSRSKAKSKSGKSKNKTNKQDSDAGKEAGGEKESDKEPPATVLKVKRLYVRDIERLDDGVGWILNECIDKCMICNVTFDAFCWKHHCRACGNVVCDNCSATTVQIVELSECHFQRSCDWCARVQHEIVHARRLRLRETNITGRANYYSISLLKKEKDYNKLTKALQTPELLAEIRQIKARLIELKVWWWLIGLLHCDMLCNAVMVYVFFSCCVFNYCA